MTDNVIGMNGLKIPQPEVKILPGDFEFHIHSNDGEEVTKASGYLKFGPQFVAVVNGPEDTADVTFAVATPLIRYVKRIVDGSIEGTLSLGG